MYDALETVQARGIVHSGWWGKTGQGGCCETDNPGACVLCPRDWEAGKLRRGGGR